MTVLDSVLLHYLHASITVTVGEVSKISIKLHVDYAYKPTHCQPLHKSMFSIHLTCETQPFLPAEGIRHIVLWESETLKKKKRLFIILRDPKLFK